MGTDYKLLERGNLVIEVSEMSNRFSLDVSGDMRGRNTDASLFIEMDPERAEGTPDDPECSVSTRTNLTPDDLVLMGLRLLTVAGYWSEGGDIAATVERLCGGRAGSENSIDVTGLQTGLRPLLG